MLSVLNKVSKNIYCYNQSILNAFVSRKNNHSAALNASIESIKSIFGKDNFSQAEAVRQHHAKDESLHPLVYLKIKAF